MQSTIHQSFLIFFSSGLTTLFAIHLLKPLATKLGLLDLPGGRKTHSQATPLIGGLAIFVGYGVSWLLLMKGSQSLVVYTGCATVIVALGVVDDAKNLSVRLRILVQIMVSLLMCWGTERYLSHLGNLLGAGSIDIGCWGILVTLLAMIGAINAFNMADGIDGLAGSLALISLSAIAILLTTASLPDHLTLAVTLIVCILPYLAANLTIKPFKHKIFMGDAGSMLLGFSVAWLLIQTTQSKTPAFRPAVALWLIAIPLMDMAAIMIRRLLKGQSPFAADRNHLHHIFLRAGFSHRQTLLYIVVASIVCASFGLIGEWAKLPEWFMFLSFMGLFVVYYMTIAKAANVTPIDENMSLPGQITTYDLLDNIKYAAVTDRAREPQQGNTKVAA